MKALHKLALAVLGMLLGLTIYGLIRTRAESGVAVSPIGASGSQSVLVDQSPLLTAQTFAQTPTTPAEMPLAQSALQVADQEMDLSFALAVLNLTQHPPPMSTAAKQIEQRLQAAENSLAAEQARVTQLTAEEAKATGAQQDALDDQLNLAKAEMDLREDEVDDAKQDLIRAGGDPQDQIQAMVQEHEAASQASDATKIAAATPAQPHGLVQRFQQWEALHQKQLQLRRAQDASSAAAAQLAAQHNSLEQQIEDQRMKSAAPAAPNSAAPTASRGAAPAGNNAQIPSHEESAAVLKSTQSRAADQKILSTLDKRIANEKQLSGIYSQWMGVVAAEQMGIVNGALRGVLVILIIAVLGLFIDDWVGGLLGKLSMERRQVETLRTLTDVALQVIGVCLVLLVIFGPPTQLGTMLGLAGAGLTVALKDFIVAFFGWFVLMGKNGIRLGDWVEINGVTGEVVELGMFHTVLLEMGNWTDAGHPTGRRVTFTNGFAVEGHYFNFSTSGQWLWDELKIVVPAGPDLHPILDAIHKNVLEATAEGAREAEAEWRAAATKGRSMTTPSTEPAINAKPVIGGTEISVRYITRAKDRSLLRANLNQQLVDLLASSNSRNAGAESLKLASTRI